MENRYLFQYDAEAHMPTPGILLADRFRRGYGFYGHRSRGAKDWLLIYTASGEGSFRVEREVRVAGSGDVVILAPGVPHHYAANEGGQWDLLWVHFIPLPEWSEWLQLPRTAEQLIHLHVPALEVRLRLEQAFGRLIQDSRSTDKCGQALAALALAEIIVLLHRSHTEQTSENRLDERIDGTLRYLAEHLPEKHRLAALARRAGLSESRFCHLFKEQTGETVTEYINKMRLHKAAKLLQITSRTVAEIGLETGFESAYYFTRRFTERFGHSPTAFRKRVWRNETDRDTD